MKRFRLWLLTLLLLGFGGMISYGGWGDQRAFQEMIDHGVEVVADMTARVSYDSKNRPSYTAELSWRGADGQAMTFRPTHISAAFWSQITSAGAQTVKQTKIRYLPENPAARPLIVADMDERRWQDRAGVIGGAVLLAAGAVAGLFALRR